MKNTLKKNPKNVLKKNMIEKCKRKLFCIELFPQCHLYEAKIILSNFAMAIFQLKFELEKLEMLPPGLPYHTEEERGRSWPELFLGT